MPLQKEGARVNPRQNQFFSLKEIGYTQDQNITDGLGCRFVFRPTRDENDSPYTEKAFSILEKYYSNKHDKTSVKRLWHKYTMNQKEQKLTIYKTKLGRIRLQIKRNPGAKLRPIIKS